MSISAEYIDRSWSFHRSTADGFLLTLAAACVLFLSSIAAAIVPNLPVSYRIDISESDLSGFDVEMRFRSNSRTVRIAMASHPEYDDRYWRYIENLEAVSGDRKLAVVRESDPVWRIENAAGDITVRYRLHLPPEERPVRDAWKPFLTPTGGMVGDLHSLMYILGGEQRPARLALNMPAGWKAASGLEKSTGEHTFSGSTELMLDAPVMVGKFDEWDFAFDGVPHKIVIWSPPDAKPLDPVPLVDGVRKLAEQAIRAFGGPPYSRYVFMFQNGGQAALEHSTSVNIGLMPELSDVFGEVAHEYIHSWNLMDVRPIERVGLKYRFADPTGVLWWSEGATMMFADLLIRRAGLAGDRRPRIQRLESVIARYLSAPGYSALPAELVSRGDTNPLLLGDNYSSTHLQGELLSTMLDLKIRDATNGRQNAADVMRRLAARFDPDHGITNRDIENAAAAVCGCETQAFFREYIYGAKRVDLDRYLALIGMRADITSTPAVGPDGKPAVDLRISPIPGESELKLRISNPQSAWGKAGLHTGDKLIAVDGTPVHTWSDLRQWLRKRKVGDRGRMVVVRNGIEKTVDVSIEPYNVPVVHLVALPNATAKQLQMRNAWINSN